MSFLNSIHEKAKRANKVVILPEGEDPRIIKAARVLMDEGICAVTILGKKNTILLSASDAGINTNGIEIIDPSNDLQLNRYADDYYENRKHKGVKPSEALTTLRDNVFFAAAMLKDNRADVCIAGATHATSHVMRAAIQILGLKEGFRTVSSSFIMMSPDEEHIYSFGDCAVIPKPTVEQLADIAISSADTFSKLTGKVAQVAFLSFSTKGSALHPDVDFVKKAMNIAIEKAPNLNIDGELQLDAAIVPSVGIKKAKGSMVAGKANVLVFPDLNAGNIGYKLTQRLGGFEAIGPIIQGLSKPMHDLSRGCSWEDIVNLSCIAIIQAGR